MLEEFRQSTGLRSSFQLSLQDQGQVPQAYVSELPFALVGSDPHALVRPLSRCPRRLFYFQVLGGRLFGMPLTRAKTFPAVVDLPTGWLTPPVRLQWGQTGLECSVTLASPDFSEAINPLTHSLENLVSIPRMVADITLDGVFAARWRLNRLLALAGRADGLTVQLIHPSVSSYHCSFVATPTGVWVVDLLSRSGIRLNDQPVAFARVRPGDTLSIGSYEFHFLPSDASASGEIPSSVLDHPQPAPSGAIVREADVVSTRPIDQQAILPIIQQFGLIHQQMMDQFQQTMMMTVQMFGKLHSEQLALIRDELDQLMTLTRELEQARHELASRKQLTVAPAVPSPRVESQSPPAQPVAPAPENRRETETRVGPSQEEMQEWLTERINKLEQERKSLWQRLLSNLSGG